MEPLDGRVDGPTVAEHLRYDGIETISFPELIALGAMEIVFNFGEAGRIVGVLDSSAGQGLDKSRRKADGILNNSRMHNELERIGRTTGPRFG